MSSTLLTAACWLYMGYMLIKTLDRLVRVALSYHLCVEQVALISARLMV